MRNLRQAVMDYLQDVHGSEPKTIWLAISVKHPEVELEEVQKALEGLRRDGELARSTVDKEYRVDGSMYCYWLPEFYRSKPE